MTPREHELQELLALVRTLLAERKKELKRLAAEVRMLRRLEKHIVKLLLEKKLEEKDGEAEAKEGKGKGFDGEARIPKTQRS